MITRWHHHATPRIIGGTGLIKMSLGDQMAGSGLSLIRTDEIKAETKWGEVP